MPGGTQTLIVLRSLCGVALPRRSNGVSLDNLLEQALFPDLARLLARSRRRLVFLSAWRNPLSLDRPAVGFLLRVLSARKQQSGSGHGTAPHVERKTTDDDRGVGA